MLVVRKYAAAASGKQILCKRKTNYYLRCNGHHLLVVNQQIEYMRLVIIAVFSLVVLNACSKKESRNPEEYVLYGKWEIGPNDGDTIEFLNKSGRNILRYYDAHFITGIYMEREYRYVNGALSIRMYPSENFTPIGSFTLRQQNREFSVMANELYPLLSSTATLIYNKIP
jgi:hypothetical protein